MSQVAAPVLPASKAATNWASDISKIPFISSVIWLLKMLASFLLPVRFAILPGKDQDEAPAEPLLFPSISNVIISEESASPTEPHPCSTGLTTRLLPFKNAKGEIEWAFTDDLPPGSELEAFKVHIPKMETNNENILSPVTSNSSNNDSILSDKKQSFPQVNTPSSTASEDDKNKEDNEDGDENHQCPYCESTFKMRGYLTRHLKKHSSEKAYKCPFHKSSIYKDQNDVEHKCHPSGGFSRRDTYKTHLKSRHFKYPKGTAIKDRTLSPGNCSMCGEWFENGETWCEIHIEGSECKHLPAGFKGKSRIKNRLKKQFTRMLREQKRKKKKHCNSTPLDYQSPILCTPSSVNTPMPASGTLYDYSNSPTLSVSSSIGPTSTYTQPQPFKGSPQHMMMPITQEFSLPESREEEFDDAFCLDTDQLSQPIQASDYLQIPMGMAYHAIPTYTN